MIHLCTIATLMFLQNNTSQKILFIAARTIQFPGVVFKVCIYLIVAIVTSSIYFDVKSTHTYRKYIYQQSSSPDRGDSEKCLPDGIVRQSQTESSAPLDGIAPRDPQTHFCSERSSLVASHRWNLFTCFLGWICNHDWSERC